MWHLFFTVALIFFAILSIPLITLLHELGHAIPALLFTEDTVTMYVGSYGDPENNLRVRIGRLVMLFKRNSVLWREGICKHSSTSTLRQIIIIAGGPFCTILMALAFTFLIFSYNLHEYLKLFILVFTVISFFSFLHNIIPDNKLFFSHGGAKSYNDGFLLKSLFKYKSITPAFRQAVELFHAQQYEQAQMAFAEVARLEKEKADAYRFIILCCIYLNQLPEALHYHQSLRSDYELQAEDYINGGLIKSRLAMYPEAIEEYTQCLAHHPTHLHCLNNRGYTLNLMGEYQQAWKDLDAAIALDPDFAFSYNNRGLSKMRLGQWEAGLADVQHSLTLNEANAYAYLHMGIYYLEKNDPDNALFNFEIAQTLDPYTYEIHEYIHLASNDLASLSQA